MGSSTKAKEKFIETAYKLFEVKGYNGVGLNEILKESGAPKGSLYYHFPKGKEELALESIKLAGERITNNLKKILNTTEKPAEALILNINNMADIIDENKKLHDMSISLIALEIYNTSEVLREACEKVFLSIEKIYFDKLVSCGIEESKSEYISKSISAMTEGAIILSLTKKNGEALRKLKKPIEILING